MPRLISAIFMPSRMTRTQPSPPHSAAKRPPGFSKFQTRRTTAYWSGIQCSASLLSTASNFSSIFSVCASASLASTPAVRAASTISGLESVPTTVQPAAASSFASTPVPQPRSSILSPAFGSSSSITARPISGTKSALFLYSCGFHI